MRSSVPTALKTSPSPTTATVSTFSAAAAALALIAAESSEAVTRLTWFTAAFAFLTVIRIARILGSMGSLPGRLLLFYFYQNLEMLHVAEILARSRFPYLVFRPSFAPKNR
jgi:hypothetical protein